jgi:hypothetical protein
MGVKGHSRGGLGTPRHLALGRSCLIPKADEGCSQDGLWASTAAATRLLSKSLSGAGGSGGPGLDRSSKIAAEAVSVGSSSLPAHGQLRMADREGRFLDVPV